MSVLLDTACSSQQVSHTSSEQSQPFLLWQSLKFLQIFRRIQAGALCRPVGKYNKHLLSSPHYSKIHHTVEHLSALLCCTSWISPPPHAIFMKGLSGVFLRSITVQSLFISFYNFPFAFMITG